jgi:alkylation response protein AidB-like acyl-CoA dehydrogenase
MRNESDVRFMDLQFERLTSILPAIRHRAQVLDRNGNWPTDDLRDLASIGAWRWFVPARFGGEEIDPLELHLRYEAIASASLATALIVSQRDSAVGLIEGSENAELRDELLPGLGRGDFFSTIGIAQLTTSRQGGLRAVEDGDRGFVLDGVIPWSTGAAKAKYIVAGAITSNGQQILLALPTDLPGVTVTPPLDLVCLKASWTSRVELRSVKLDKRYILRGPVARVLSGSSKGIPLSQAFLAFGLCRGALELMASDDSDRAKSLCRRFDERLAELHGEVVEIGCSGSDTDAIPRLRAECTDLTLRITQAAVALRKGSALVLDDPAQRLAREALFFLVWSCPDPVIDCTVNLLSEKK